MYQYWDNIGILIMLIWLMQAYAERAKKVNEDKEKEEARREAERLRFWFFWWLEIKKLSLQSGYKLSGMRRRRKETPHHLWPALDLFRMVEAQLALWEGGSL